MIQTLIRMIVILLAIACLTTAWKTGPYYFLFKGLVECTPEQKGTDEFHWRDLKLKKVAKSTFEFNGKQCTPFDGLGDADTELNATAWRRMSSGRWGLESYAKIKGPLDLANFYIPVDLMEVFYQIIDLPFGTSPFPKVCYHFSGVQFPAKLDFIPLLPQLAYGTYNFMMQISFKGRLIGCQAVRMEVCHFL